MKSYAVNIFALLSALILVIAFESGFLVPANAFFAATAMVTFYTGYQLLVREGMPFFVAVKDIATRPKSYPRVTSYAAYLTVSGIGFLVAGQAIVTA